MKIMQWFKKDEDIVSLQSLLAAPDQSIAQDAMVDENDYTCGLAVIPYELLQDGDYNKAEDSLSEIFYDVYHHDNMEYEPEYNLFQFVRFDPKHTLDNLKQSAIVAKEPHEFNDPLDPIIIPWLKIYRKAIKNKKVSAFTGIADKVVKHYRIRCFSYGTGMKIKGGKLYLPKEQKIEDINPLMWAHYADGHKGFCLKCRIDMEDLKRRYNTDHSFIQLRPIKYVKELDIKDRIGVSDALVTKGKYWEYENEMRLIYFSKNIVDKPLLIKVDITDIYLGVLCSDEIRQKLQNTFKHTRTKFHKMAIDPDDVTRLYSFEI